MPKRAETIDDVIIALERVIDRSIDTRSRVGYFAALYRQVTVAVRDAIANGEFEDGPRMDAFDTAFGNRYLEALEAWQSGGVPTKSWKEAFRATDDDGHLIVQHLLLGVNAHINLDLGIAAAEAAPGDSILDLKTDFDHINRILVSVLERLQGCLDRCSPLMRLLDDLGGRTDEEVLGFNIRVSRAEAWEHALLLARAPEEDCARTIRVLDRQVAFLARIVRRPVFPIGNAIGIICYLENDDVASVLAMLNSATGTVSPPVR